PNWRWMVKSNSSERLGLKFGSSASPEPAEGLSTPFWMVPGKYGCGSVWLGGGPKGATNPSQPPAVGPMRKVAAGSSALGPGQVLLANGIAQAMAWLKPVPSSGTSTRSTPFRRP